MDGVVGGNGGLSRAPCAPSQCAARRLRRAQDQCGPGIAGHTQHVRRRAAGGGDPRRVRFARRHPARIRAAWPHRADTGRSARRRMFRKCGHRGRDWRARRSGRRLASHVQFRPGAARIARDDCGGASRASTRIARRLSRAGRLSRGPDGARRRLCGGRQLQISARRNGRLLSLSAPAPFDGGPAHASIPAGSPSAMRLRTSVPSRRNSAKAATRSSSPRRPSCRSTRRVRGNS